MHVDCNLANRVSAICHVLPKKAEMATNEFHHVEFVIKGQQIKAFLTIIYII